MKLVPGRPITSLSLIYLPFDDFENTWSAMTASTFPITHLTVGVGRMHTLEANFQAMVPRLHGVQELALTSVQHESYDSVRQLCVGVPRQVGVDVNTDYHLCFFFRSQHIFH